MAENDLNAGSGRDHLLDASIFVKRVGGILVGRYVPSIATAIVDPLSRFWFSRPTIHPIHSGHPLALAWNEGNLATDLQSILDKDHIRFTLLCPFTVRDVCLIDQADPATIVIALHPGSTTLDKV